MRASHGVGPNAGRGRGGGEAAGVVDEEAAARVAGRGRRGEGGGGKGWVVVESWMRAWRDAPILALEIPMASAAALTTTARR